MSVEEVVQIWESFVLMGEPDNLKLSDDQNTREGELAQLAATPSGDYNFNLDPAGTPAGQFIASWLPIAEDQNGSYLVIDRRHRRQFGRVLETDKVDVDVDARSWPSLSVLLTEVADALDQEAPATGNPRLRPSVSRNMLDWVRT